MCIMRIARNAHIIIRCIDNWPTFRLVEISIGFGEYKGWMYCNGDLLIVSHIVVENVAKWKR